jgi:hypothetical protein
MPVTRSRARVEPQSRRSVSITPVKSIKQSTSALNSPLYQKSATIVEEDKAVKEKSRIQVIVRKRPLTAKEELSDADIVVAESETNLAVLEHK